MGDLRVSCVVPVHDGARHLGATLASIAAQSLPPLEVIVVDDGSADASAEIAESFGALVRVERQTHQGVSRARNRGVELARGELLAFLDADDLFLPHKLVRQRQRFLVRPELGMVAAHSVSFWSPEVAPGARDHDPQHQGPWPRHLSTWLVRREAFERVGGFDEGMPVSQDVDWHLRAHAAGVVVETLPDVLTHRRLHEGNTTRRRQEECRAAVVASLRRHLDRGRTAQA